MAVRKWIRSHPLAIGALAIVCLLLTAALMFRSGQYDEVTHAYYYDLDTGQLFSAPLAATPILTPSGKPRGVVAMVLGCGGCSPKKRSIGWLQTSQPESSSNPESQWIAKPPEASDSPVWFDAESPQALTIIKQARQRCKDLVLCTPDS